ncbi:MAG: transcription repressor NadR [Firmicutes bacterium]|nr:transcription repressor NadR [Bacillota bacterium]MBQ6810212.1 transcription repressor NadR [Bacillota bacterium]
MNGTQRREQILSLLRTSDKAYSGTALGEELGVSRQIIVQDIALLRREGHDIVSTVRGYLLETKDAPTRIFKVFHSNEEIGDELTTIVDLGGIVVNVMVNHKVYGKIYADMNIKNRRDISRFTDRIKAGKSTPLLNITSGYHYHEVSAESEEILDEIEEALRQKNYLAETAPPKE